MSRDVEEKAQHLIQAARGGEAGFLIVDCYRFFGHARKDKSPYRDETEETFERQARDPVALERRRIVERGEASVNELQAIEEKVSAEMNAAVEFAIAGTRPGLNSLYTDVYGQDEPVRKASTAASTARWRIRMLAGD